MASKPILTVVERKLSERFPKAKFSWFDTDYNLEVIDTREKALFEKWVKGIDTAITAVGD